MVIVVAAVDQCLYKTLRLFVDCVLDVILLGDAIDCMQGEDIDRLIVDGWCRVNAAEYFSYTSSEICTIYTDSLLSH